MILCWAPFVAILGCMWLAGRGLDTLEVFCTAAGIWGKKPKVVGMPYREEVRCCGHWQSLSGTIALPVRAVELWVKHHVMGRVKLGSPSALEFLSGFWRNPFPSINLRLFSL